MAGEKRSAAFRASGRRRKIARVNRLQPPQLRASYSVVHGSLYGNAFVNRRRKLQPSITRSRRCRSFARRAAKYFAKLRINHCCVKCSAENPMDISNVDLYRSLVRVSRFSYIIFRYLAVTLMKIAAPTATTRRHLPSRGTRFVEIASRGGPPFLIESYVDPERRNSFPVNLLLLVYRVSKRRIESPFSLVSRRRRPARHPSS